MLLAISGEVKPDIIPNGNSRKRDPLSGQLVLQSSPNL
jgi:hypothetical protein